MARNVRLGELILGIHGLAIMRQLLRGTDEEVRARVSDLADFCTRLDEEPLSASLLLPEMDPIEGYRAWAGTYDGPNNPLINLEGPVVHKILEGLSPGRAIDVACGTGRHTSVLLDLGHSVVGVDATMEMLRRAQERLQLNLFSRGDARRLPFKEECADIVVCALALTHFEELRTPIAEFSRVLRPGGHAVISDLHPLIRAIGGGAFFHTTEGSFGLVREHLHLQSDYLRAFRNAGLSVIDCREPTLGEEQLKMFGFGYDIAPEAQRQSHMGLPFGLIWHLVKS